MKRLALFVMSLFSACAAAQAMTDPMRPPQASADSATAGGPVLQSVFIGKDNRHAIISGERVTPGGSFGDAKVVQIMENQVLLRDAAGDTVLKLYPQVEKSMSVTTKPVSHDAMRGEKGKK